MVDTDILNWTLNQALSLIVIMVRVGPLIFLMPVFNYSTVPPQVKALFTLLTAFIILPVVPISADLLPQTPIGLAIFVVTEFAFGAILAFFARLLFAATDLAGQMVSISMGMGMAGAMDPQFGTQVSLVGYLWNIMAILIFLSLNGHHFVFTILVDSFTWLHPGGINITDATYRGIMKGVSHMFVLAIQIMAPASAALFFSHVAMGIIAKTVPQVPIMIVAMPMNIAIGFIFVGLSLTYLLPLLVKNFDQLGSSLTKLAIGMGG
jgi:flagellar biosynthetic protein FliR